ncbi:hypothetical protein [Streptomyces sp. SAJ15]|uniref:hypothetical protein n=1 Tax=Streptomyces sp. SAJ15 TaxID=2011095 RepID=UPI0021B400F9|nr:hypothetical protein [Streptomyces sp. SAJ15]
MAITPDDTRAYVTNGNSNNVSVIDTATNTVIATVTVQDTLPKGLIAAAIGGTGWNCSLATLTCTRGDALAPGDSYPPITLTVRVSCRAAQQVTNTATVTGGGSAPDTATDTTAIRHDKRCEKPHHDDDHHDHDKDDKHDHHDRK